MARLSAAIRRGALAPALQIPHPVLQSALKLRRGQLSLWVAAPGVGKTQMLHNIAHRTGVPTMYWSADTDEHDTVTRAMAMWSGNTVSEVEERAKQESWRDYYARQLDLSSHVDFIFDAAITGRVVKERMDAFAEIRGPNSYPHLVVVDNLSNTVMNPENEIAEQKEAVIGLQRLARESKAHVAILAHATGEYEDGTKPIPQSGVMNKLAKWPEVVVTMHRQDDAGRFLGVNVVKLRGGQADPSARHAIQLEVDYSRATVKGFRQVAA